VSNTGAQAFYRSLGFISKGILKWQVKIDGRYEDEVFMERFLWDSDAGRDGEQAEAIQ
jgi:RimJ/RimL family protein N-acetyltransferase